MKKENNCKIINLLNKNDPFYTCGPSEFLWLEKNAFLICTDAFHSCVFALVYNKPFVVLGNLKRGMSRFESLLNMFGLEKQLCFDLDKFELNNKINYGKVNLRLGELKSYSFEYLKECLK